MRLRTIRQPSRIRCVRKHDWALFHRHWFCDRTGLAARPVSRYCKTPILSDQIEADGTRLVTSQAIILEIGAALSKSVFRPAAVRLIEAMQSDPLIDVIPVSDERLQQAFALFKERADKEWSLADCLSFDIMRERGIVDALTPDMHFAQAGFAVLMRDG